MRIAGPVTIPAPQPEGSLGPYLRAIRRHKTLVALCVLLAVGAAAYHVAKRDPSYKATAEVLVTPLPADDTTFQGLPFLRDFGEASRTLQTAAALIESPAAADLAARRLGSGWSRKRVEDTVVVTPLGQSDVLAVEAKESDARLAADAANTFAQASLDVRRAVVRTQVLSTLARLEAQQRTLVGTTQRDAAAALASQISALQGVRDGADPTLSLSERAAVPTDRLGVSSKVILILAILAGFAVGAGVALVLELGERSVRDEDELQSIIHAPVLARSPLMRRRSRRAVTDVPPAVREAFRTLRIQLERHDARHRTILVTSANAGDGKTTSAINLAMSLVGAGHRVLLIDFDLRKPDVAKSLGIPVERGLAATLTGTALADIVVSAPEMPALQVVPAAISSSDLVLLESLRRRMPAILEEASALADYVVIDSAPIGEVADALTLVDHVDDIVLIVRPGHSNRANLETARDLVAGAGGEFTGLVLIGGDRGASHSYHYYGTTASRESRRTGTSSG